MSSNNNAAATTGYSLPAFPAPPPLPTPLHFTWTVDGVEKLYGPSVAGVLTYCIPRIHISVDENFVKNLMKGYFDLYAGEGAVRDVCRIDFQPIEGNTNFKRAFVYHEQYMPRQSLSGWLPHFNSLSQRREGMWSGVYDYSYNQPLVDRITESIFEREHEKSPIRVPFHHNGRDNFWLLLPNLNPMTENQRELAEEIAEETDDLVGELANIAAARLPVPNEFDHSVLFSSRVQTAWVSFTDATTELMYKLHLVRTECERIRAYALKNGVRTIEFDEEMELMQFEHDEDNAAIEALDDEVARGDWPGEW
jgi:hypothetical protein